MPGRLVDAAALGLDDAVLDLVAHAQAVAAADAVGLEQQLDLVVEARAVERDRQAFVEARRVTVSRWTATSSRQKATPMIGCDDRDAAVQVLQVLGLVRRAQMLESVE